MSYQKLATMVTVAGAALVMAMPAASAAAHTGSPSTGPAAAVAAQQAAGTQAATASSSSNSLAPQGCAIKAHKVSRSGPIKGKVTATNCRGWTVWYGMQVDRWHGWTRIAGKDGFSGKSGKKTYTVKACKLGTYNYRMYIGRNGGIPRAVSYDHSGVVRRTC